MAFLFRSCTLFAFLAVFSLQAFGQTIPNGDLETWPTDPNTGNRVPANWITFRTSASRGTAAPQHGFAYADIQSVDFFGSLLPGILRTRFAANRVPGYLNGYFRTSGTTATDSLYIWVRVFSDTTIVGQAQQGTYRQSGTWVPFGIQIYNLDPSLTPDSMAINIYTFRDDPTAPNPSIFSIDYLTLADTAIGAPLGTEIFTATRQGYSQNLGVLGNPSTGAAWELTMPGMDRYRYTLTNTSGQSLRTGSARGSLKLETTGLPAGIYLLTVDGPGVHTSRRLALAR